MTARERRVARLWTPLKLTAIAALIVIAAGIEGGAIHV